MTAALCEFVASLLLAAPVPKDKAIPVAPPPRSLLRFHALQFVSIPDAPHERVVGYGECDAGVPRADTLVPLVKGINHVAVDPKSKAVYAIRGQRVYLVPRAATKREHLVELKLPAELTELSWPCGLTFDTKRERVVVVSLGGKGRMYAYAPKTEKWTELTDMNNLDLVGLSYSPKADVLYGLYESRDRKGEREPRVGIFDPVSGQLKGEIVLSDPDLPAEFGRARGNESTVQLVSAGSGLLMLTDTHLYRLDLGTKKITVEWKK